MQESAQRSLEQELRMSAAPDRAAERASEQGGQDAAGPSAAGAVELERQRRRRLAIVVATLVGVLVLAMGWGFAHRSRTATPLDAPQTLRALASGDSVTDDFISVDVLPDGHGQTTVVASVPYDPTGLSARLVQAVSARTVWNTLPGTFDTVIVSTPANGTNPTNSDGGQQIARSVFTYDSLHAAFGDRPGDLDHAPEVSDGTAAGQDAPGDCSTIGGNTKWCLRAPTSLDVPALTSELGRRCTLEKGSTDPVMTRLEWSTWDQRSTFTLDWLAYNDDVLERTTLTIRPAGEPYASLECYNPVRQQFTAAEFAALNGGQPGPR